jgi:hypothetical protein
MGQKRTFAKQPRKKKDRLAAQLCDAFTAAVDTKKGIRETLLAAAR